MRDAIQGIISRCWNWLSYVHSQSIIKFCVLRRMCGEGYRYTRMLLTKFNWHELLKWFCCVTTDTENLLTMMNREMQWRKTQIKELVNVTWSSHIDSHVFLIEIRVIVCISGSSGMKMIQSNKKIRFLKLMSALSFLWNSHKNWHDRPTHLNDH